MSSNKVILHFPVEFDALYRGIGSARVVPRYKMLGPKQSITPSNLCSARNFPISFNFGSRLACVIGCIGAV